MRTNIKMRVTTMKKDESWQLFVKNAGDVANLAYIQPLAKENARECGGLPLGITVIGTSMRGKTRVEVWKYALDSLRRSEPNNKNVKDKVYSVIKWSYDSSESRDIRKGILGEHDTYEQAYNRGITLIENLKDACLLEADKMEIVDCVQMHDVVRDVARWIASTIGDEHTSVFQDGIGLTEISHIKLLTSVKRISFVSNEIECLPDCFPKCQDTKSLLLQDNEPLDKIPHKFFLAFPALRVLNLSETSIRELASFINSLCQQRSLILQSFFKLTELPPVANLHILQVLDCEYTKLRCLPQGMENLTNLRLLNMLVPDLKSIGKGFFIKFPSIEISSDQATLFNSEIPRFRKLELYGLPELGTLEETQRMWEHLEELKVIACDGFRKLPLSIKTSKNIKIIEGKSQWWSQLEWDDDNFKSNLEHCYKKWQNRWQKDQS
ncbi:hypothetical protein CQW23_18798 [Capsicum baccatum]|uniref:Uncharacterized protein n=1 Tax=Capsicum baccatum TaxID=33114 RepID=A0A2G2W3Z0_CAPBA|nr:hypothetical protein CQW23_18798 [Capsicum baccatum]